MSAAADELAFAGLASLSRRLRARDVSPVELADFCLARSAALGPPLGCFALIVADHARASARAAAAEIEAGRWRGPLHGIPFGLADAIDTCAIATGLGLTTLASRTPERDATAAARLAEQGAVLVGKLQVYPPAGAVPGASAPAASCRTPWDPRRPAGGPSPGPAAAVAAGLVPFAISALGAEPDTAAGECGVTALRPTYGVLSRRGAVLGSFTLAALGTVARSAEDCAIVLDAIAGADPRDPSSVGAPPGIGRLAAELPRGLRVGVLEIPPSPREAQEAWAAAQEALRGAGAIVAPATLPELPWAALADVLAAAEGIVVREDVLGPAGGSLVGSTGASAADYVRASRLRGEAQRALARLLERHDLLLSPAPRPSADGAMERDPLSAAIALGGLPALTLPIGLAGARPVAARFVAPPLEEGRLLSAAALFQSRSSHHLAAAARTGIGADRLRDRAVTDEVEHPAVYVLLAILGYPIAIALIAVGLPLQAALLALTAPFDRNRRVAGRFLRILGVLITKTFPPWRLRVEGRWPGKGPFVVVANHQSMLDILMLSRLPREMKWVAKEELFRVPWVGWMLRMSGDIPIRRGDAESGGEALARAKEYLARGMSVMIFPEGTRSARGTLLPFKSGAFRLALEAGVPVLPVAVHGTAAGMPKGGPWVRPCRAFARILEPVETAGRGVDATVALRDEVRRRIAAELPAERERAARGVATQPGHA